MIRAINNSMDDRIVIFITLSDGQYITVEMLKNDDWLYIDDNLDNCIATKKEAIDDIIKALEIVKEYA